MLYFILAASIAAFVSTAAYCIKHTQRQSDFSERERQALVLELESERSQLTLLEKRLRENAVNCRTERDRLKKDVEARTRRLSAKALYLSERNQMMNEVLSRLVKLPQVGSDKTLYSNVQALKEHIKADAEWEAFILHFDEVNRGFIVKLKAAHPSLTAGDIRFLSYVYMNLTTKEIAAVLNITPESCRKRKERITAKLNLPSGMKLYDYLASLV